MSKQRLNFAGLYEDCKNAVESALTSMWIGETLNESQKDYARQLKEIIGNIFAPNDAIPLVECINPYESVPMDRAAEAEALVGDLWKKTLPEGKYYPPYKHQARSWQALQETTANGDPKSIVVTTGTGSGKTECFMLPLVEDLIRQKKRGQAGKVQAIFLYPLNALMEDQKERLEKLMSGTGLRYAVYNGNLAEHDDPNNQAIQNNIRLARGTTTDEATGETYDRFPSCVATRDELRSNPPEILLTNPTMLEYILLREKDSSLIEEQALRWVVIDETHTYNGAGAAELAMLLRRVMLAFGLSPRQVRFATSSATIGNKMDPAAKDAAMRKFIAGITGVMPEQIEVINGKMVDTDPVTGGEYSECWNRLFASAKEGTPYMPLDKLLPGDDPVLDKLKRLEKMFEEAPKHARVKVHYFFRVPNGGLFVRLSDKEGGSFKIYTARGEDDNISGQAPLLELSRCKKCGEFIAIARGDTATKEYGPIPMDDTDMFDLEPNEEKGKKNLIFALTRGDIYPGDGNQGVIIDGNEYKTSCDLLDETKGWEVVMNTHNNCPYCGTKLTKKVNPDDDMTEGVDEESAQEEDGKKLQKFRVPVYFISQLMAPVLLNQLEESSAPDVLHRGQQYISFIDSRQGAAQATLQQNIETEKLWLYSKIYHELNRLSRNAIQFSKEIEKLKKDILQAVAENDMAKMGTLSARIAGLEANKKGNLSWNQVAEMLDADPMSDVLVKQFAKRTASSEEFDENGEVTVETKRRYIQAIMVEYLGKRPVHAASPETMGLFTPTYPQLDVVLTRDLPKSVKDFNDRIDNPDLRINAEDWKNLMQVFLDYSVRTNESIFLRISDRDPIDIFNSVRFATQKNRRRPAVKSTATKRSHSRVVRYLAQLMVDDGQGDSTNEVIDFASDSIQAVVDALWEELIRIGLLLVSTHFENGRHVEDPDLEIDGKIYRPYRLNVLDMSFKLYENVVLADTMSLSGSRVVKRLRPVETRFKNFSPYLRNYVTPVKIDSEEEHWKPYPYETGESQETIEEWAKDNRKLLWDNQLWNEFGTFANRLTNIHKGPEMFIQAEHTAQVDKMIARKVQEEFKKRRLNILACSTTMEMGVDLGSLELVMMCSVPPMPSNYKQRAGRSGRSISRLKSAAITLCGSDSIGLRTLYDPIANVIDRVVSAPTVDLQSPQVLQRHVNAFLIRESGVFNMGDRGGTISQRVFHYYTNLKYEEHGGHSRLVDADGREVIPTDQLTMDNSTPYIRFNEFCSQPPSSDLQRCLGILLKSTFFDGQQKSMLDNAIVANKQSRNELLKKVEFIGNLDWNSLTDAQKTFFTMKFYEPLMTQLIGFWATTRFTPNANMPVNVVSYDVTSSRLKYYTASTSNPSYDLRNALSQYVPGNSIAMDGRVSVVRGVRYHDFFAKKLVTFKTIYRNAERIIIDAKDEISRRIPWNVNGQEGLKMIQPTEFLPDTSETENRILERRLYTRVNAQLIGASKWTSTATEPHLFSARSSRQSSNSEILYYNDGIGYGFCHCRECGKIVMESAVAKGVSTLDNLPAEMNNREPSGRGTSRFHFKVGERDKNNKPVYCYGSRHAKSIDRNIVLADTILTDYTEIRVRYAREQKWISDNRDEHEKLLTTLALVFTQAFTEYLGKEREAFDFAITPNGHICIFDTNPGGAGYSNQLAQIEVMTAVLKASKRIVEEALRKHSKDMLLDKYTIHLSPKLNLTAAYQWLTSELNEEQVLPEEVIATLGESAAENSLQKLEEAVAEASGSIVLFFDSNIEKWNYGDSESGWFAFHGTRFNNAGAPIKICVLSNDNKQLPLPAADMLINFRALGHQVMESTNQYIDNGIYPLALIDSKLFVTNNPESASLNEFWANGFLYSARLSTNSFNLKPLDLQPPEGDTTCIFKLTDEDTLSIQSAVLGEVIYSHAKDVIDRFAELCKNSEGTLAITYQDEHLKSALGITVALQTIDWFVRRFNLPFTVQFKVESYYENSNSHNSIAKNLSDSGKRDAMLKDLTSRWLKTLEAQPDAPSGEMLDSASQEKGSLTHWRELSFQLGDAKLSIYPDGGFINGWKISDSRRLSIDNMDVSNSVGLRRKEDIKFDVTIENV